MDGRVETRLVGDITVTLRRPESRLAELGGRVREVLGVDLPDEIAAFYRAGDGLHYSASRGGADLGLDASICGLEDAFAGFQAHRVYKSAAAYEKDLDEGNASEGPFYEELWGDDFDLSERGALARLNVLRRSKLLVSVPGASHWLTIDYLDPKRQPYGLGLAADGCDYYPLDLGFSDFVAHFERFGATGWYFAFVGKKGGEQMNIDLAEAVARALEIFSPGAPDEVASLVQHAKGKPTKKRG